MSYLNRISPAAMLIALVACVALNATQQRVHAATVNFSSIEVSLAEPNNSTAIMNALWTGWQTQVYEYNMPFIELANNEAGDTEAISEFRFTIGDSNYQFSNEFMHKDKTNSNINPANGEYAVLGYSTPDVDVTSSLEDDGNTVVLTFGNGGLQPGEVVRFQVDINADNLDPGMMYFAPYTEVFFNNDNGADVVSNSEVSINYVGSTEVASAELPDYDVPHAVSVDVPRAHSDMQMIDPLPGLSLNTDPVPEPSTLAMLSIVALGASMGRRRGC